MLKAFEVNVRRALVHRVHQDGIDQLHHWRFVHLGREHTGIDGCVFLRFEHFHIIFFRYDIL